MPQAIQNSTSSEPQSFLKQVLPFNESRFDDCVSYLAHKHGRELSVYELMKLHVMIDVFHCVQHGKPVIGGPLFPFTNGPVSRSSKYRVSEWCEKYQVGAEHPERFKVVEGLEGIHFAPVSAPSDDEFSDSELDAMQRAWDAVIPTLEEDDGFNKSQRYFHSDSFIGRAWSRAKKFGRELDWDEIIDEYDRENSTDHSHIKIIMRY